jgi:hypothetical protein
VVHNLESSNTGGMRLLGQVAVGRRSPDPERLGELPYGFTGGKVAGTAAAAVLGLAWVAW